MPSSPIPSFPSKWTQESDDKDGNEKPAGAAEEDDDDDEADLKIPPSVIAPFSPKLTLFNISVLRLGQTPPAPIARER